MSKTKKILVAQLGSRRNYQQPILLHQWGMLDTLYTDFFAGDRVPFNVLRHTSIYPHLPASLKRLVDRYDSALKGAKVVHFPLMGYHYATTLKQLKGQNPTADYVKTGKAFCQLILKHGLGESDTVYGFNSASLELFQYAKQRGLRCVLDQTLAERSYFYQLMQAEELRWHGWSIAPFNLTDAERELAERERKEQDLADQIICGSEFVKDSLILRGVLAEKIAVIPLGRTKEAAPNRAAPGLETERHLLPWKVQPEGLHILFAGSVGLRKGIPYLLEALRQLKHIIPFVCKVAGSIELQSEVLAQYCDVCQFLGRVSRREMDELYRWANVFVLPSLCEGSAMVTYEALLYGLPIIVTHNTGSMIQDGLGGWIIPVQNAGAIVESLLRLFENGVASDFSDKAQKHMEKTSTTALAIFKQVFLNLDLSIR